MADAGAVNENLEKRGLAAVADSDGETGTRFTEGIDDFFGNTLSSSRFNISTFALHSSTLSLTESPCVSITLSLGLNLAVTPKSVVPGERRKETCEMPRRRYE
jgi:hypothetical protein